jgi:enoyl-CoA hydratase/carnithine racemase
VQERVVVSIAGGVADVRMNRPDKMNALDSAMFAALIETGEALRADPAVRAVVLSGVGRSFCAGLDVASFASMADPGAVTEAVPRVAVPADSPVAASAQHAVFVWRAIPVPVIAAVHGHALGGGCQLALGADLRIVHPDAQLSVLEIRWGLVPDMCGTQLLPELVGLDVAKELTFTGRMVGGEEAVRIGLATRTSQQPYEDALAMATGIAGRNPHAIRAAKTLFGLAGRVPLAEGFAAEQREIRALIGSPNQVEAVSAFFAKRDPVFADPA